MSAEIWYHEELDQVCIIRKTLSELISWEIDGVAMFYELEKMRDEGWHYVGEL